MKSRPTICIGCTGLTPLRTSLLGWLLLTGCGGTASSPGLPVSAFVGNYSGEWNRISPNWATQNGTIAMTVATNGVVNGTSTNSVRGNGIVDSSGSFVSTGGRFQLVLTYNASGSPVPISDVYVGALRPDSTGRLRGTLHENLGDFNAVVSIDLQKL